MGDSMSQRAPGKWDYPGNNRPGDNDPHIECEDNVKNCGDSKEKIGNDKHCFLLTLVDSSSKILSNSTPALHRQPI
jgi:hypothetical protein